MVRSNSLENFTDLSKEVDDTLNLKRIYVWQIPIRLFHWINAICIFILFTTGLYIGNPIVGVHGEAAVNFLMGSIRYWHLVTAMIFTANMLFRLYWFLVGNEYSKLTFWYKSFWRNFHVTLKYYLFVTKRPPFKIGHNSFAQLFYLFFIWLVGITMIVTGMAMRAGEAPQGVLSWIFGWVIPTFGGEYNVRILHHLFAWGYAFFIIGHLYMIIRQDILEKDGTVTSIINGYKFIEIPTEPEPVITPIPLNKSKQSQSSSL